MKTWGILGNPTPEKVQEWMNLPYGKFKEMVADIKKNTKGNPLKKHAIEIQDITTSYRSAFIYVDAANHEHALKLAELVDKNTLDWSDVKQNEQNKYSYRISQIWD